MPIVVRLVALTMMILPLGYYLELTDASFSHCLYSRNKAVGFTFRLDQAQAAEPQRLARNRIGGDEYLEALNVQLPHEHRLIEASFGRSNRSQPGDFLYIYDPRLGAKLRHRHERWFYMNEKREVEETERPAGARGHGI